MPHSELKRAPRASHGDPPGPGDGPAGRSDGAEEPPPLLGSWNALYAVVLAGLALMIALCWAITRWAE